jgi:hypothetical protein
MPEHVPPKGASLCACPITRRGLAAQCPGQHRQQHGCAAELARPGPMPHIVNKAV